jgi:iron-sulfur cluster assembly protein CyaY
MDESEFLQLADACLTKAAKWLENLDPDQVDYTTGDGVVTIEFPDGVRFVLSRQRAAEQIWLAAVAAGFHYSWDASSGTWRETKDRHELFTRLAELLTGKLGQPVDPA